MNFTQIFPAEKYPKVATNLEECRAFVQDMEKWIEDERFRAMDSERKEGRYEHSAEESRNRIKNLEGSVQSYENMLSVENDPDRIEWLEVERDSARNSLRKEKMRLRDRKATGEMRVLVENAKQLRGHLFAELLAEATAAYLNDYVAQGHLGAGTVVFQGREYVAESVGA